MELERQRKLGFAFFLSCHSLRTLSSQVYLKIYLTVEIETGPKKKIWVLTFCCHLKRFSLQLVSFDSVAILCLFCSFNKPFFCLKGYLYFRPLDELNNTALRCLWWAHTLLVNTDMRGIIMAAYGIFFFFFTFINANFALFLLHMNNLTHSSSIGANWSLLEHLL